MPTETERPILESIHDLKLGQSSLMSDVGALKDQGKNTNKKVEALDKNLGTRCGGEVPQVGGSEARLATPHAYGQGGG